MLPWFSRDTLGQPSLHNPYQLFLRSLVRNREIPLVASHRLGSGSSPVPSMSLRCPAEEERMPQRPRPEFYFRRVDLFDW